ncbi:uncharacterized protein LOC129590470 [Paramacrobiotus metropolitanus]|uniref:uncharacterized protein LOC129590470 n=1 Tax=Paramacrobiotus metropolitanus TaxID=2943436 RepID=UPI0024459B87|nr:uncharacterized protein LOC129590470 [Paramacrobiotus metropolitanus]
MEGSKPTREEIHSVGLPFSSHGYGGALGVDISSSAPQASAPAALHFHQVLETIHSGDERVARPAAEIPVSPSKVIDPRAPDEDFWKDKPKNPNEGVLSQVMSRASEIYEDYRDRAGEAIGDLRERASGVWHTVAGAVAVASGKELTGRPSQVATQQVQEPGLMPHGDVRTPGADAKHGTAGANREKSKLLSA